MTTSTTPPSSTTPHRAALLAPVRVLRGEGLALLVGAVAGYALLDASWWLFAALLLLPDLGLLGYLLDPRVGSVAYNLTHTTTLPLMLGVAGLAMGAAWTLPASLVWLAHIGMDRALGYGLKYPGGFRDTHLQHVA